MDIHSEGAVSHHLQLLPEAGLEFLFQWQGGQKDDPCILSCRSRGSGRGVTLIQSSNGRHRMGSEVDGAALADLIDKAAVYCAEQTKWSETSKLMRQVGGARVVQNVSVRLLEFLAALQS